MTTKLLAALSNTKWLYGIGLATTLVALASTLVGLPYFRFGVWYQSEPIFFVNLLTAGVMSGVLMLLIRAGEPIAAPMRHPAMQLFTAFVLWSVLSSMTASIPMRSFFGAPETAEGTLWYATIWVATLMIASILRDGRFAKHLFWGQWFIVTATTLSQVGLSEAVRVFKWGDYLGIISIYYIITMAYAFRLFPQWHWRALLVAPAPFALLVSHNQAAVLIVALCTIAGAAWWAMRRIPFIVQYGKYFTLLAIIPPIIIALAPLSEKLSCGLVDTVQVVYSHYPSCDADDPKVFNNSTIGSRVLFYSMAFDAMADHPEFLVTGAGFGTYADLFYRYAFTGPVTNYTEGTFAPSWMFGQGHVFHPHHSWLYILISTGVPGFLFWLGALISLFWFLSGSLLIFLGSAWVSALLLLAVWFAVPMVSPFMAIAIACSMPLSNNAKSLIRLSSVRPKIKHAALGSVLTALFISSFIVWDVGIRSEERLRDVVEGTDKVDYAALPDYGRGYMHQWWLALSYSDYLTAKRKLNQPYTENDIVWTMVMLRTLENARRAPARSIRIDGHYAAFINDIMVFYSPSSSLWHPLVNKYADEWRSIIRDYMIEIPSRGDVPAVFFEFWLKKYVSLEGAPKATAYLNLVTPLESVLSAAPDHPIAIWYQGRLLAINPQTRQQGLKLMKKAYDAGVNRFVPVTNEIKTLIDVVDSQQ